MSCLHLVPTIFVFSKTLSPWRYLKNYFGKLEILLWILVSNYSVADTDDAKSCIDDAKREQKTHQGLAHLEKKDNAACFLFYCGGMLNIDHRKFLSQYNGPLFNIEWIFKEFKTQGNTPNWFSPMKKNNYLILIRKLIWREHVFLRLN